MRSYERQIEEAEAKARGTIADILALINRVPQESIPEIQEYLDRALSEAKTAAETERTKTKVVKK